MTVHVLPSMMALNFYVYTAAFYHSIDLLTIALFIEVLTSDLKLYCRMDGFFLKDGVGVPFYTSVSRGAFTEGV